MITKTWLEAKYSRLLGAVLWALCPGLAGASVAGHVQFVAGDVRIVDAAGKEHAAQKGQEINEGETVLTAAGSSAQLKMIDGGILALRPDTQLRVDNYVYHGAEDGSENALLSLVKGGLRTITGLIGHQNKEKLKLRTPTATIGVRGTDHEPVVIVEPTPGTPITNPAGTYDKVNVGSTRLTTDVGSALIAPNQVGYAAALNQPPVLLPKIPEFYRATPTPLAKVDQKQGSTTQSSSTASSTVTSSATPTSSTTTSTASTTSTAESNAAAVATPVLPVANLTGVDASGNVLNLSQQTLTTSSGQVQALSTTTSTSSSSSGGSSSSGNLGSTQSPAVGGFLLAAFPTASGSNMTNFFSVGGPAFSTMLDANGNLTGATVSGNVNGNDTSGSLFYSGNGTASISESGSTVEDAGNNAATGLAWGRWQGGTVTATQGGTSFPLPLGSGSMSWITGQNASPTYLAQILTGTASYSLIGGTKPSDFAGNTGVLGSGSLNVNFNEQTVASNLNFTFAGNSWGLNSGNMLLNGSQFSSCPSASCTSSVVVTENGSTNTSANSNISGFLTGTGLTGAALQYSLAYSSPTGTTSAALGDFVQGVAAFSLTSAPLNPNAPFSVVGVVDGWNNLSNIIVNNANAATNGGTVFNYLPSYRGSISGGEQPQGTVTADPNTSGGVISFIGQASGYVSTNSAYPVPSVNSNATLDTIKIGSATDVVDGSATIDGITVTWGRWAGGIVNIYSLDGSTQLGTVNNSNRSISWITASGLTSATFNNMPTSGNATYSLAGNGGTIPTDTKGNTGTLNTTTTSLTANFTNATVSAFIEVSFSKPTNTSDWTMSAPSVAISNSGFNADTASGGGATVTCSGAACPTGTKSTGFIEGHFIAGAQGAVMLYGMSNGTIATSGTSSSGTSISTYTPAIGVSGLVAMKH